MSNDKINVLLDLDNTIINSLEPEELKAINSGLDKETEFESKFNYENMNPYFRIFARPHLEEFLDYLFDNFNVGVWTAAESEYALFIIKHFIETKPSRKLNVIFYRYHVDAAERRYGQGKIKDMRLLWEHFKLFNFYPYNTILIDDLIDVKQTNHSNVFQLKSFDVLNKDNKPNQAAVIDRELYNVMDTLEEINKRYKKNHINNKTIRSKFVPILNLLL